MILIYHYGVQACIYLNLKRLCRNEDVKLFISWLVFNSTFSTTRLYRAMQKFKFVKDVYFRYKAEDMLFSWID